MKASKRRSSIIKVHETSGCPLFGHTRGAFVGQEAPVDGLGGNRKSRFGDSAFCTPHIFHGRAADLVRRRIFWLFHPYFILQAPYGTITA